MTARDYLGQAYRLDQRINNKLEQVASLNELATKATCILSGMPKKPNMATTRMADTIGKIVDLQAEINRDLEQLMELKRDIVDTIKAVDNMEYRFLLERRYLCFKSWDQIAVEMGYNVRHAYRLHDAALNSIKILKSCH